MARILESGIAEMQRGQMFRTFVDQASSQFDALATPEAQQIAQLIRSDPRGATAYVNQFGGWEQIYNQARANAGRQALTEAIGRLSPANGAATSLTQQQVLQQILPVVMKYGVGEDLLGEIAQAYGSSAPKPNIGNVNPADVTPESLAEYARTGDYTVLRRVAPSAPPASVADFTPESIRRWQQTGDIGDLRRRPPDRAPAERQPPAGWAGRPDGSLAPIPGGPAEYKAALDRARLTPKPLRTPEQQQLIDEAMRLDWMDAMMSGALGPPAPAAPPSPPAPQNSAAAAEERLRVRER